MTNEQLQMKRRLAMEIIRLAETDPETVPDEIRRHFEDVYWHASVELAADEIKDAFNQMTVSAAAFAAALSGEFSND